MANLADDDLLLVQRTSAGISTNYSITGSALKEDLTSVSGLIVPPVEVLTPINGAGITEFDQYEPLSSAITAVGEAGTIAKETDEIQSVVSPTGAANLDRNNASWINIPSGVSIGTSEFTFECFFYVDSFNNYGTIFDSRENTTSDTNQIYLGTSAEEIVYLWTVNGSGSQEYRYLKTINTGQWYHLALVRDSNNLMHLYIDGTHADKKYGDYYHSGSINTLTRLGQSQLDGPGTDFVNVGTYFEFDGKLSNVRVTIGQALYTSDFTVPPTPLTTTSQGATASNVKLLCCQSTTDVTAAAVSPGGGYLVANGHAVATSGPGGSDTILSFPTNTNFSGLSVGDVVKPGVSITSIDASATPPTISVNGGTWTTSDRLTSSTPYETSLTFTDATELANMVAPLEMADATGGNSLIPTTSIVSSTAVIPAENLVYSENKFQYSGATTYNTGIGGNRMVWFKTYGTGYGIISDSVNLNGQYIPTGGDTKSAQSNGITFNSNSFTDGGLMNSSSADHVFLFEIAEAAEVFDIVSYTGNGSSSHVIPHNLGVEPGMIIIKELNNDGMDWVVWHKDLHPDQGLALNQYLASNYIADKVTAVSSENFTVNEVWAANKPDSNFVAYVFGADTAGKVKCGIYSGNNSDNTINVGFAPGFVLLKNIDAGYNWAASTKGLMGWSYGGYWEPNQDGAASVSSSYRFMQTSSGFRVTGASGTLNESGNNYIYLAIAETITTEPKTELTFQDNTDLSALTSGMTITGGEVSLPTFSVDTYSGNNGTQSIDNGIDLAGEGGLTWIKYRDGLFGTGHYLYDTERETASLFSNTTDPQNYPDNRLNFDSTGFNVTIDGGQAVNASDYRYVAWSFRKAPEFFDIVTYTGNGASGRTIPHNLGSVPGFIMVKELNNSSAWVCYHKSLGNDYAIYLNWTEGADGPNKPTWSQTSPTSTEFSVSSIDGYHTNDSNTNYIAYLFADNPANEIKCDSYLGNATGGGTPAVPNQIDCGFRPKFVLIKNAGNTTDWHIFDDQRGDRWLKANENEAEGFSSDPPVVFNDTGFSLPTGYHHVNQDNTEHIFIAIGSPTVPGGPATGTLVADADPSTNTAVVDATSWPIGDSVTGPSLSASLTSILEVSGNTIFGNGSTGSWISGYYAEGSEINAAPPGPSEVTFTSQNQGTPAFSGVDATLTSRTWTLESGTTATGPWTVVDTYEDYDVLNSQDGATPWTSNKPNLTPNTFYRVKVRYDSLNAESVESVYNTFKTGDA